MTLAELRDALRVAQERLVRANEQIETAGADADVDALQREFDDAEAEIGSLKQRISRAQAAETATADLATAENERAAAAAAEQATANAAADERAAQVAAAETRAAVASTTGRVRVGGGERTYRLDSPHSFLGDIYRAFASSDSEARERLERNNREQRAQSIGGSHVGSEFLLPELYLGSDYARIRDAGRPFANAIGSRDLPPDINSVRVPRVTAGLTADMQTEGQAYSTGDISTDQAEAFVQPIGHYNDLSRQLVERTDPTFEQIFIEDQLRAVNLRTDNQLINGTGTSPQVRGIRHVSGIATASYTDASPTGAEFITALAKAFAVHIANYQQPTVVLIHPRRWSWLLGAVDGNQRPLVLPAAYPTFNQAGENATPGGTIMGTAGTILGVPVIVDGNVPATNGAGTNEDVVEILTIEDLRFWESQPKVQVETGVVAHQGQVRIITYRDVMFLPDRFPHAITEMTGTGLVTPA